MPSLKEPEVKEGFYYRDSDHHYFMDGKPMTGCTTILGVIAKPSLIGWAARMAVEHTLSRISDFRFEENGSARKAVNEYTDLLLIALEEARTAHAKKRDKGAEQGTDTHALVEAYINLCIEKTGGKPLPVETTDPVYPVASWAAKENIRFIASEKQLYSKDLWVAGTCDLIFEKDGKTYVGDIKTYKKIWDRTPMLQCAGYALMYEEMGRDASPHYVGKDGYTDNMISGYCIINLPKERAFNESEDIKWSYDIEGDTNGFKAAVTLYRTLENW